MKNNDKKMTNTKISLFFKAFFISVCIFSVLVYFVSAVFTNLIKPLSVSQDTQTQDLSEIAFLPPEGVPEDMLIGNGLQTPKRFTNVGRKEQFYTFLFFGLDEGINVDTIMVASYDAIEKKANLISIPRDTKVNVNRNVKKINAAYPAGTLYGGGKDGGVEQLKREIKTIIGFVPDFYIYIDLDAFVKIVDAIGGVEVDVPFDLKYSDSLQNLYIDIKKGKQILNGNEALKFARYRKNNNGQTISDYQRIENQHTLINAILTRLLNPLSLLKIPEFITIFNDNVNTDIKPQDLLWFASQLRGISSTDTLNTYILPTNGTSGLPMYYEYLDEEAVVELINKTINPFNEDIKAEDLDILGKD